MTTATVPAKGIQPAKSVQPQRSQRLPRLNSLRLFAAIGVVLCHVGYFFTSVRVLRKAEVYGYGGVEFFFLLSGFVLTWAWANRRPQVRSFWWRRVAKLYPITLALMVFAYLALPQYERIPGVKGKVLELTLLQAWWPSQRIYFGGNGVSWSLSCEIFFYLVFPFVLAGVKRLRTTGFWTLGAVTLLLLVMAPLIANLTGVSEPVRYWLFFVFPPYQFGFFLLGMLMARAVAGGLRFPKPTLVFAAALVWLGALVAVGAFYSLYHNNGLPRPLVLLVALPAFVAMLVSAASKDLRHDESILTSRKLTYLGVISFELYLVHKPLFLLVQPLGVWNNSGGLEGVLVFAGYLGIAIVVAIALHHLFQAPIERVLTRSPDPLRWSRRCGSWLKSAMTSGVEIVAYKLKGIKGEIKRVSIGSRKLRD
ncbi:acyltransferase family protein [Ferrimicrobium acidiphilum]|uniref:acyltransferase family protein n=1 Tax=Ferrimicrobium acidiphilum TaxID=121039 RepID=UPI0023F2855B|nr:acyltransferase [Ferrimicrobium acidiphilum]